MMRSPLLSVYVAECVGIGGTHVGRYVGRCVFRLAVYAPCYFRYAAVGLRVGGGRRELVTFVEHEVNACHGGNVETG